jgi:hypothetical protein
MYHLARDCPARDCPARDCPARDYHQPGPATQNGLVLSIKRAKDRSIHQSDRGLAGSFGTHFDVTMISACMFICDDSYWQYNHWLFYQNRIAIFSQLNPSGSITCTPSPWNWTIIFVIVDRWRGCGNQAFHGGH